MMVRAASTQPNLRLNGYQLKVMRRDPVLIKQFSDLFILPNLNPIEDFVVTTDCWRSLNGRPYQRWIYPNIDFIEIEYNHMEGHVSWIMPTIPEVNTLEWLEYLDEVRNEWIEVGSETIFFADFPEMQFQAKFEYFTKSIGIVLLKGEVELDIYQKGITELEIGKLTNIPFNTWHTIKTFGEGPSCWVYVYTYPGTMSFHKALGEM